MRHRQFPSSQVASSCGDEGDEEDDDEDDDDDKEGEHALFPKSQMALPVTSLTRFKSHLDRRGVERKRKTASSPTNLTLLYADPGAQRCAQAPFHSLDRLPRSYPDLPKMGKDRGGVGPG